MESAPPNRPPIDMRVVVVISDNILFGVGMFLNLFLLYLIIEKSSNKISNYRLILVQNCLVDTFYNVVNFVFKTQPEFKSSAAYVFVMDDNPSLSIPARQLIMFIWLFALFFCVTAIPVQFVYRYFLIYKRIKMTKRLYCSLLFGAIFGAALYGVGGILATWPNEELYKKAELLLRQDPYYHAGFSSFLVGDPNGWKLRLLYGYCYFLVFSSYFIIIFTSVKVLKYLKCNRYVMNAKSMDCQQQITKTLAFQALIPCVTCLVPIGIAVSSTFLQFDIPGFGIYITFILSWMPVINPTITIIAVKNYRNTVAHFFSRFCPCCSSPDNNNSNSSAVVPGGTALGITTTSS